MKAAQKRRFLLSGSKWCMFGKYIFNTIKSLITKEFFFYSSKIPFRNDQKDWKTWAHFAIWNSYQASKLILKLKTLMAFVDLGYNNSFYVSSNIYEH